jgi:hypothetical protein
MYLVINSDMFGRRSETREYVDWTKPDLFYDEDFRDFGLGTAEEFAEKFPHMIVVEIAET